MRQSGPDHGPGRLRRLSPDDAWSFALAPVDAGDQSELLGRLADAVMTGHSLEDLVDRRGMEHATIAEAEAILDLPRRSD